MNAIPPTTFQLLPLFLRCNHTTINALQNKTILSPAQKDTIPKYKQMLTGQKTWNCESTSMHRTIVWNDIVNFIAQKYVCKITCIIYIYIFLPDPWPNKCKPTFWHPAYIHFTVCQEQKFLTICGEQKNPNRKINQFFH